MNLSFVKFNPRTVSLLLFDLILERILLYILSTMFTFLFHCMFTMSSLYQKRSKSSLEPPILPQCIILWHCSVLPSPPWSPPPFDVTCYKNNVLLPIENRPKCPPTLSRIAWMIHKTFHLISWILILSTPSL